MYSMYNINISGKNTSDVYMTCMFSEAGRESPASVQSAETALDSMARRCVEFQNQCWNSAVRFVGIAVAEVLHYTRS